MKLTGQKRYVIECGGKYWRSRGNQHQPPTWVVQLDRATMYREAKHALSAAKQVLVHPDEVLSVQEVVLAVTRTTHRLSMMELSEKYV